MSEIAKTADLALRVLLEVAEDGPTSEAELSRALVLNRTVVHRLLTTLQRRGFVRRQENGYVVGPVVVRLADLVEPELRRLALPVIRRVSKNIGETVVLSVPDDRDVVVVEQSLGGDHMVKIEHKIGSRHPLHLGASGRAILGFLPDTVVRRALRGVEDPDKVRTLLEEVRQLGFAVSHDELQRGVYGTAAPVLGPNGRAVATVAIVVPLTRIPVGAQHAEAVLGAARELAADLFRDQEIALS